MNVELDLSNYATKANFKNAAGVDTSKFYYLTITKKLMILNIKLILIMIMINILQLKNFLARLKQVNLAGKNDIANFRF